MELESTETLKEVWSIFINKSLLITVSLQAVNMATNMSVEVHTEHVHADTEVSSNPNIVTLLMLPHSLRACRLP